MKTYLDNICPLCNKIQSEPYFSDKKRDYLKCTHCHLVYVAKNYHISSIDEKKQYDFHTNNPQDQAYRHFLSRLFTPLKQQLNPASKGLDFGSGPGPTLSLMFEEAGFDMHIYDLYYADNREVFDHQYDFVSATEVIEHLKNPAQELNRFNHLDLHSGNFLSRRRDQNILHIYEIGNGKYIYSRLEQKLILTRKLLKICFLFL